MAKIAYPGDISDGDPVDAASVNDRMQPVYKALNATGISGSDGIQDDEIQDGAISPSKIAGTCATLDDNQDFAGNKTFTGAATFIGEVALSPSGKGRQYGGESTGANGGSSTDDTTPDANGTNRIELDYTSATTITAFDNPGDGQTLLVTNIGSVTVTLQDGNGADGAIVTQNNANIALNPPGERSTVLLVAINDGTNTMWNVIGE